MLGPFPTSPLHSIVRPQVKIQPPELKGMMDKKLSGERRPQGQGLPPAETSPPPPPQARIAAGSRAIASSLDAFANL